MRGRARLEFDPPAVGLKKVHGITQIDLYVARITDGNNKEATRLLFRARGDKQFYFLFPDGTEQAMKIPAGWCQQQLERLMPAEGVELPKDKVSVPMGDPTQ
jgi:hypothetical protein